MENQIENQNQRIEVIEDSIQRIIKALTTDYKLLHENLADYKARKERETEENKKFLEFLEQNNRAMESAQRINQSHFEAQDYIKEQTDVLKKILDKAYQSFVGSMNVWGASIEELDKQLEELPKLFAVEHHHHIVPKSKGLMIMLIVLVFLSVAGLAWGFANYEISQNLQADQVKYRIFRQQLPDLNRRIDSLYYENPERAAAVVSKLEAETELRKAAEAKRREAEEVAKEAAILQQKEKPY
jgi:hypothetical protein